MKYCFVWVLLGAMIFALGCSSKGKGKDDDTSSETNTDPLSSTDNPILSTEFGTESSTDSVVDTDSVADTDSVSDTDSASDTDSVSDTDSSTDSTSDTTVAECALGSWLTIDGTCAAWSDCAPGTYMTADGTSTTDRTCSPCAAGTFTSTANAVTCTPWTNCSIGEYVVDAGSFTVDRTCAACTAGTFSNIVNTTACTAWTDCTPGTSVATSGTATSDRSCMPCATGTYSDESNTMTCMSFTDCEAGTFVTSAGTATTNRTCSVCATGSFSDTANAASCAQWIVCEAGEYISAVGSATTDRICATCELGKYSNTNNASECTSWTDCEAGTRVASAGATTADRSCVACEEGSFTTGTNATDCTAWTDCEAGTHIASTGSASTDRTCTPCDEGTFTTGENAVTCDDWTVCEAGTRVLADGSTSADRVCTPCEEGTFTTGENAATCGDWTVCQAGTYVLTNGSATVDRICTSCDNGTFSIVDNAIACDDWTVCAAGTRVLASGTSSADRTCTACEEGTFTIDENATTCVAWRTCTAGTFVSNDGSDSTDRICTTCDIGTFTVAENATYCDAWTVCEAGNRVLVDGSASADRICVACEEGTFTTDINASTCNSWTVCDAGTHVVTPGSNTTDRTCAACESGTFTTGQNAATCNSWTVCDPGTQVVTPGSATADRTCTECEDGTYSANTNSPSCTDYSPCPAGTAPIEFPKTQPLDCVDCAPGQYCPEGIAVAQQCSDGTRDDDSDPGTPCVEKETDCVAGEYVTNYGDPIEDRLCAACTLGTDYTDVENAPACTPLIDCGPGNYMVMDGTLTTDRECALCPGDTYNSAVINGILEDACIDMTVCVSGEYVAAMDYSKQNDRECANCVNSFSVTENAENCTPWSDCGDDWYVSGEPSTITDRTCAECGVDDDSGIALVSFGPNAAECFVPDCYAHSDCDTVDTDDDPCTLGVCYHARCQLGPSSTMTRQVALTDLETVSVQLQETQPDDAIHGEQLSVDKETTYNTPNTQAQVLLRFEDLADNIPVDYVGIEKATLAIQTSDAIRSGSPGPVSVYQMLTDWDIDATWNTMVDGIVPGADAADVPDDSIENIGDNSLVEFNVTDSVLNWLDDDAPDTNYGWAFINTNEAGDGWYMFSETGDEAPSLILDLDVCKDQCSNDTSCDDNDPCTIDTCEPTTGFCANTPIPECVCGTKEIALTFGNGGDLDSTIVEIDEGNADGNKVNATSATVDRDSSSTGKETQVLWKIDNFEAAAIAHGLVDAKVVSAELSMYVTNGTTGNISIYRMLTPWDDTATWNGLVGGVSPDNIQAAQQADFVQTSANDRNAYQTMDVTSSVNAWFADSASNQGWAILTSSSDGWVFNTEFGNTNRPMLTLQVEVCGVGLEFPYGDAADIIMTPGSDSSKINFSWYSESETNSRVQIGLKSEMNGDAFPVSPLGEFAATTDSAASGHYSNKATANSLLANTEYVYRVGNGEGSWSDVYELTTGQPSNFEFLALSDAQIGASVYSGGTIAEDAAGWNDTLSKATAEFSGASFVISAGDQVETATNENQFSAFFSPEELRRLPVAPSVGNHDVGGPNLGYHFNLPNLQSIQDEGASGIGDYYFTYGDVLFIHLNSNSDDYAGHEAVIAQAIAANPDMLWKIAIFHHDIYGTGLHAGDADVLALRAAIAPVFDTYDFDVVFSGHDHSFSRSYFLYNDEVQGVIPEDPTEPIIDPPGTVYFTLNSSSGSKYYPSSNATPDYIYSSYQNEVPGFSHVTVDNNTLTVQTFETDTMSVLDVLVIQKTVVE